MKYRSGQGPAFLSLLRPTFDAIGTLITENQNFGVFQLARNDKHGAGFVQTMQFPGIGYGCQP